MMASFSIPTKGIYSGLSLIEEGPSSVLPTQQSSPIHSSTLSQATRYQIQETVNKDIISIFEQCRTYQHSKNIITNKDVFWYAFCHALSLHQNEQKDELFVSIGNESLIYFRKQEEVDLTKRLIEGIRQHFEVYQNRETFKLTFVAKWPDYHLNQVNSSVLQLSYPRDLYIQFIKPALKTLATFCKACLINSSHQTDYLYNQELHTIEFQWHTICYPIAPVEVLDLANIQDLLYQAYLNKEPTEWKIVKDEEEFNVNVCLLQARGGMIIQHQLQAQAIKQQRRICISDYSVETVRLFVDFIHLGPQAFLRKMHTLPNKGDFNLVELFCFAHYYQITQLVNCCTNLMSLSATPEYVEIIKNLVDQTQNEHLKQLYSYLSNLSLQVLFRP